MEEDKSPADFKNAIDYTLGSGNIFDSCSEIGLSFYMRHS